MILSRQYLSLRRSDVKRLGERIPHDCPIAVRAHPTDRGFQVVRALDWPSDDPVVYLEGRFQVVAAFVDGFVRAWRLLV